MQNRWIWPFELEEKIGDGGMGVVYRARYVKNNRYFAVKLLPLDLSEQTILARFEREMDVLKTLKHPNIVRCFGGVCGDKQRFYAMELVEGGTLAEVIREKGQLPWDQVIEFGLQMCRALEYAHSKGVIHRDVKPANLLRTNTGRLKLSDFGLIAIAASSRLTADGKTMGTIPYMSPEQIRGKPPPSPQTDLYALGCVLFEMIVGHPPFKGDTPAETMHLHLHETPPRIGRFTRDCPKALEQLIQSLLEKNPENRPSDATTVARKLQDIWHDAALGAETVDVAGPESPDLPAAPRAKPAKGKAGAQPVWLLGGTVAVIFALLVWNLILLGKARQQSRAEALWIETFQSDDPPLRVAAARALGEIESNRDQSVELLQLGLSDPHVKVRLASISALGELGVDAKPAIGKLRRLQNTDANAQVRTAAAETIEMLHKTPAKPSRWPYYLVGVLLLAGVGAFFAVRKRLSGPSQGGSLRPSLPLLR